MADFDFTTATGTNNPVFDFSFLDSTPTSPVARTVVTWGDTSSPGQSIQLNGKGLPNQVVNGILTDVLGGTITGMVVDLGLA